jgi:hypothetical protein
MKKILLLGLLIYGSSCANPEDRATGNPDSSSFNSDEEKVTNSMPGATDPNSLPGAAPDSSSSPSTDKNNSNSKTDGTNRGYGGGRDSGR